MHTTSTYTFETEREAVKFAALLLNNRSPHEDLYVTEPQLMSAETIWPREHYTGPIYDQLRKDHVDHWRVRVERFS